MEVEWLRDISGGRDGRVRQVRDLGIARVAPHRMSPALGLFAGGVMLSFFVWQSGIVNLSAEQGSDCQIKGNISDNGRIYHDPGQRYYSATRIDRLRGERWFCSESEEQSAGWRRSGI